TSWLPFPFWTLGSAMAVFGRGLLVARLTSLVVASAAAATPYLALRATGTARKPALAATALAFLSPWSLWLGAATVPESMTASLAAAGAIGLGAASSTHRRWPYALALLLACLSRYEAWPIAAVVAAVVAARAARA